MKRVRAHFDGRVLVPEEPLDLPVGIPLEIVVRERRDLGFRIDTESGLPVFNVPADAKPIDLEAIRRALDEE